MKAKALFLIALLSLATPSCGILKMFKKSNNNEETQSSEKVVTDEQKVKNYLDREGEGEFHDVLVKEYIGDEYPAVADVDVVWALRKACEEFNVKPYLGIVRSHDAFYIESPGAHEGYMERIKTWSDAGVLAVENESSALFTISSLLGGIRAGTILLTGGYLGDHYGSMSTSNKDDYQEKVDLMTKITLRAIEIIDKLADLEDVRL